MDKEHTYTTTIKWTGNLGQGTIDYLGYERAHTISAENKIDIAGSSDPAFRGDRTKYNPEELLVSSISSCHMLWYLNLCAEAGIVVTGYTDEATGILTETIKGGGKFKEVILNPKVTVQNRMMVDKAKELHHKANELCFIANSVNFPVYHYPIIRTE